MSPRSLSAGRRADIILRTLRCLLDRPWSDIDVILGEYGLPGLEIDESTHLGMVEAQCRVALRGATESTLIQLAAFVLGEHEVEASGMEADSAEDLWGVGVVRLFLSHLAPQRGFVGEVSEELKAMKISSFVAHDSIEVSREWQTEIERALRTADALVGLAHPGFCSSFWTQQEVGWALGRRIPVLLVGIGEGPRGFPARYQAPMLAGRSAKQIARSVAVWLCAREPWGSQVIDSLVSDLQHAQSFVGGRDAARRLQEFGKLPPAVLDAIEHAYLTNDQLYPKHVGAQVIDQILRAHGRTLPSDTPFQGERPR